MDKKLVEEELDTFEQLGLTGFIQHIVATIRCSGSCKEIIDNPHFQEYVELLRKRGTLAPEVETLIKQADSLHNFSCDRHSLRDRKMP